MGLSTDTDVNFRIIIAQAIVDTELFFSAFPKFKFDLASYFKGFYIAKYHNDDPNDLLYGAFLNCDVSTVCI